MTERYLEDFQAGLTFGSGGVRVDAGVSRALRPNAIRNRFISTSELRPTHVESEVLETRASNEPHTKEHSYEYAQ